MSAELGRHELGGVRKVGNRWEGGKGAGKDEQGQDLPAFLDPSPIPVPSWSSSRLLHSVTKKHTHKFLSVGNKQDVQVHK